MMAKGTPAMRQTFLKGLRRDKTFAALDEKEQIDLCEKVMEEGTRYAWWLKKELLEVSQVVLKKWLWKDRIRVEKLDVKYQLPYIAEYEETKKQITLYTNRITDMQKALSTIHPEYFEKYSLEDMCLAHECFHHLERKDHKTTGRLIYVEKRMFGLIPYKHYFAEGSEIAAHMFVSELMGLPFTTYTMAEEAVSVWKNQKGE